ncbi:unnamed protein product, partial [Musa banksii]
MEVGWKHQTPPLHSSPALHTLHISSQQGNTETTKYSNLGTVKVLSGQCDKGTSAKAFVGELLDP